MPSIGPASSTADRSAQIIAAIRSNASSCTGRAGEAVAQVSGSMSTRAVSAAAMAPAMGQDVSRNAATIPAPRAMAGDSPAVRKSA